MFSRFLKRLLLVNLDPSKCNVHTMSQISDANFKEAVGKCMKVQVSRAPLFFHSLVAHAVHLSVQSLSS